jgi:NAD(P)-dependent dehydrogenase (short-subunit alcohol dehydrogenase family)
MTSNIRAEFEGRVVLVTGAASGIGRAVALMLHERGAKVIAEDKSPTVEQLAKQQWLQRLLILAAWTSWLITQGSSLTNQSWI